MLSKEQLNAVCDILVEECGLAAAGRRQLFELVVDAQDQPTLPHTGQLSFSSGKLGVLDLQIRPDSLSLVSLSPLSAAQKAEINSANERLYDLLATPLERGPRRRPSSLAERARV